MKDVVKGYDNTYSAPDLVISQSFGDVIMSSGDSNPTVNDGFIDAPPDRGTLG